MLRNLFLTAVAAAFAAGTSAQAASIAIDFQPTGSATSTIADFQAADPNLLGSTLVTASPAASSKWTGGVLDATYDGLTFSTAGSEDTITFQASNGNWTTDRPILDGYAFGRTDQATRDELVLNISGFAALGSGQPITLTTWGVGDSLGQQTSFNAVFGASNQTLETYFGDDDAGANAVPFVQFSFLTDGVTDVLTLTPDGATAAGSNVRFPINAISLSVGVVPEPISSALLGLGISAVALCRRR